MKVVIVNLITGSRIIFSLIMLFYPVSSIGDNCKLVETPTSDHTVHTKYSEIYIDAVNSLKREE